MVFFDPEIVTIVFLDTDFVTMILFDPEGFFLTPNTFPPGTPSGRPKGASEPCGPRGAACSQQRQTCQRTSSCARSTASPQKSFLLTWLWFCMLQAAKRPAASNAKHVSARVRAQGQLHSPRDTGSQKTEETEPDQNDVPDNIFI